MGRELEYEEYQGKRQKAEGRTAGRRRVREQSRSAARNPAAAEQVGRFSRISPFPLIETSPVGEGLEHDPPHLNAWASAPARPAA
jgi:hypothetical protein